MRWCRRYHRSLEFGLDSLSDRGASRRGLPQDPRCEGPTLSKEFVMSPSEKLLYTGKVHTTGGRAGATRSSDGRLDVKLSLPGAAGEGTNPEQLFAAGG